MSADKSIEIAPKERYSGIAICRPRIERQRFDLRKQRFGSIDLAHCLGAKHHFCPDNSGRDYLATPTRLNLLPYPLAATVEQIDADIGVDHEDRLSHFERRGPNHGGCRRTADA